MPLTAIPLVAAIAAVFGALSLFGALVSAGAWLVRRLALPVDPPETCRFEPRPPAVGDADGALRRAEAWERRRTACESAAACYRDAVRIHEILGEVTHHPDPQVDREPILAALAPAAERAEQATDEAAAAMHGEAVEVAIDRCRGLAAEVAALRTAAEQRRSALPPVPGSYRALILLGALLVVVLLWLLVALPLLQDELAAP